MSSQGRLTSLVCNLTIGLREIVLDPESAERNLLSSHPWLMMMTLATPNKYHAQHVYMYAIADIARIQVRIDEGNPRRLGSRLERTGVDAHPVPSIDMMIQFLYAAHAHDYPGPSLLKASDSTIIKCILIKLLFHFLQ